MKCPGKDCISLDWHPEALKLFYDAEAAEDIDQDDSLRVRMMAPKLRVKLEECLEFFTAEEFGEKCSSWYDC